MQQSISGFVLCLLVVLVSAGNVQAQDKGEKAAIEKVVRTFLVSQGTPGKHDDLHELCVEGATFRFHSAGEDKSATKTLPEQVQWWTENVTAETAHVVDSVRVVPFGKDSHLAAAFVDFHTPDVHGRDVFTLMLVGEHWQVVSLVQQNRPAK